MFTPCSSKMCMCVSDYGTLLKVGWRGPLHKPASMYNESTLFGHSFSPSPLGKLKPGGFWPLQVERLKKDLEAARQANIALSGGRDGDHVNVILCFSHLLARAERFSANTSAGSVLRLYQVCLSGGAGLAVQGLLL